MFPKRVKIVEVGPRDGLQNEPHFVPTDVKIELINILCATGLTTIEATSFVSPKWIPQLADAKQVLSGISELSVDFPVLVPNVQGLEDAISAGAKQVAVFTTASQAFCKKNTNQSVEDSLSSIKDIIHIARQNNISVRGYISCVLGCPYQGNIAVSDTLMIATKLFELGCYEISLGDTIGIGTPNQAVKLVQEITKEIPIDKIAVHFHDTYGQALANIYATLQLGVNIIDCSIAGLGGCPYARGASGNVATEDVVYMLNGMNIDTGIDFSKLLAAGQFVARVVGHSIKSKTALAHSVANAYSNN